MLLNSSQLYYMSVRNKPECLTLASFYSLALRKHETKLQRLARGNHSNLIRKFVNYGQISFIAQDLEQDAIIVNGIV
jgi:hypothetical protein